MKKIFDILNSATPLRMALIVGVFAFIDVFCITSLLGYLIDKPNALPNLAVSAVIGIMFAGLGYTLSLSAVKAREFLRWLIPIEDAIKQADSREELEELLKRLDNRPPLAAGVYSRWNDALKNVCIRLDMIDKIEKKV